MERSHIQFIDDMITSIVKIENYTKTYGIHSLREEGIYYDAVLRNLEIIGEASKSVPENIKVQHPDIPWREIYGLRNIITHAYFGIDISEMEFILENDLPNLKTKLLEI